MLLSTQVKQAYRLYTMQKKNNKLTLTKLTADYIFSFIKMLQMSTLWEYQVNLSGHRLFDTMVCGFCEEFMYRFIIPGVSSVILI